MKNQFILSTDLKPLSYLCVIALEDQLKRQNLPAAKISNFKALDDAANAFGYSGYSDMLFKEKSKKSSDVSYLPLTALEILGKHFARQHATSSSELISELKYLLAFQGAASQSFSIMHSGLSGDGKSLLKAIRKRARRSQNGDCSAIIKNKLPYSLIQMVVAELSELTVTLATNNSQVSKLAFSEASVTPGVHGIQISLKSDLSSPEFEVLSNVWSEINQKQVLA